MNVKGLAAIDLNLLVAFAVLIEEGSVTRAAARIGLSQPAMSNALSRLRDTLDDPVLVRSGGRMVPTPRALDLAGPIREALGKVAATLTEGGFDPAASHRFRIAMLDYAGYVLLPGLAARLAEAAPGATLEVLPIDMSIPERDLATGRFDLAIGVFPRRSNGLQRQSLFGEGFVCLVRADHPTVGRRLGLRQFAELPHALISSRGDVRGVVDHALAAHGLERRVAIWIPHFLVAPLVVAQTDYILTIAARVAARVNETAAVRALKPPVELQGFAVEMMWHPRTDDDAACVWLRAQLTAIAAQV